MSFSARKRALFYDKWPAISAILCALFGIVFTLNIHPIGDGLWFWYSYALRHGEKLYRDMHVPMQPLFIFATEWTQRILGNSWLASKFLAISQDVLYCFGLYLVVNRLCWTALQKALLISATFGTTIMAFYYRFDDYHITGHCLVIFSIYLILLVDGATESRQILRYSVWLGLLSGLAVGNRLNDGALLYAAAVVCLFVLARRSRVLAAVVCSGTTALTLLLLVLLTGNSLSDWAENTIFRAAAIKGGTGHMLTAPFHFPLAIWDHLTYDSMVLRNGIFAFALAILVALTDMFLRQRSSTRATANAVTTALLCVPLGLVLLQQSLSSRSVLGFADASMIACYFAVGFLLIRFLAGLVIDRSLRYWYPREVLILFPFGQMFSGAMTSGQSFLEGYTPLAILILLLPFIVPAILKQRLLDRAFTTLLIFLTLGTCIAKSTHPYYWHHYDDRGFFLSREWYNHPLYGPMYIDTSQRLLMQDMCSNIHSESGKVPDLLAMPWPYPNYFCGIPPWHGYVQTWYDTTSKSTIDSLIQDLQRDPPQYIAYQRGLDMIAANEVVFNAGKPLPHRALDRFIAIKLRSGQWSLPWQRCFGGTDWLLIRTRPAFPNEANDVLLPTDDHVNLCSRTDYNYLR